MSKEKNTLVPLSRTLTVVIIIAIGLLITSSYLRDMLKLTPTPTGGFTLEPQQTATATALSYFAVTKEDASCFSETGFTITISRFEIVNVVGKNNTGEWLFLRINNEIECWASVNSLDLKSNTNSLPIFSISLPVTPSAVATSTIQISGDLRVDILQDVIACECNSVYGTVRIKIFFLNGTPPFDISGQKPVDGNTAEFDVPLGSGDLSLVITSSEGLRWEGIVKIPSACEPQADCGGSNSELTKRPPTDTPVTLTPSPSIHLTHTSTSPAPTVATLSLGECNDGIDNDGDGLIDLSDPQCASSEDNDESGTQNSIVEPGIITNIWFIALGLIIAVLLIIGIQRFINSTLPIAHNIAFVGLPRSGKTTLITSLFGEIFARKTIYKSFQASLSGKSTIDRINKDISRLERGLSLGPTNDQDIFAYRTNITLRRGFLLNKIYKVEMGDFPGEQSRDFVDGQMDLVQSEEYFKWMASADAIVFVIDLGVYLDLDQQKNYVADMSAAVRSAWQKFIDSHDDGESIARKLPVTMVFNKVDLAERIQEAKSNAETLNLIASLGYGDRVPELKVLNLELVKQFELEVEKSFSDLLKFLQSDIKHFTVVYTSCFGLVNDSRLGLFELLKAVLPK